MFTSKTFYLKFKNYCIPFQNNLTCESSGILYIIKCSKCNVFYIGKSGKKAKERIGQHFYNINYFRQNIRKS